MGSEQDLKIIEKVMREMKGTTWNDGGTLETLLECVEAAGDGDYLEIGVLHGGSICAVALKKKALGHKGMCYGIDPFQGFKGATGIGGVPVTLEVAQDNVKRFRLSRRARLIKGKSFPLPVKGPFSCVFIDGDHEGKMPLMDWMSVKDICTGYVDIHDYNYKRPMVVLTCHTAAQDKHWEKVKSDSMSFVMRRKA